MRETILDSLDLKILKELQADGDVNLDEMSHRVGLSATSCHRRIKRLESQGVIRGRTVLLDEKKVGIQVTAIFMITLERDDRGVVERMERLIASRPEIAGCYLLSGDFDFMLIAKFADATEYTDYIYHFLETFHTIPIRTYTSKLVVRILRQSTQLPLDERLATP